MNGDAGQAFFIHDIIADYIVAPPPVDNTIPVRTPKSLAPSPIRSLSIVIAAVVVDEIAFNHGVDEIGVQMEAVAGGTVNVVSRNLKIRSRDIDGVGVVGQSADIVNMVVEELNECTLAGRDGNAVQVIHLVVDDADVRGPIRLDRAPVVGPAVGRGPGGVGGRDPESVDLNVVRITCLDGGEGKRRVGPHPVDDYLPFLPREGMKDDETGIAGVSFVQDLEPGIRPCLDAHHVSGLYGARCALA